MKKCFSGKEGVDEIDDDSSRAWTEGAELGGLGEHTDGENKGWMMT